MMVIHSSPFEGRLPNPKFLPGHQTRACYYIFWGFLFLQMNVVLKKLPPVATNEGGRRRGPAVKKSKQKQVISRAACTGWHCCAIKCADTRKRERAPFCFVPWLLVGGDDDGSGFFPRIKTTKENDDAKNINAKRARCKVEQTWPSASSLFFGREKLAQAPLSFSSTSFFSKGLSPPLWGRVNKKRLSSRKEKFTVDVFGIPQRSKLLPTWMVGSLIISGTLNFII